MIRPGHKRSAKPKPTKGAGRGKKPNAKAPPHKSLEPVQKALSRREAGPAQPNPPKSEYNPRGLKVAEILAGIHQAFDYDAAIPVDLTSSLAFRVRRPRLLSSVTGPIAEYSILSMGPKTVGLKNLMDADQMAILPNDADLAKAIQQHPTLVLVSDEHADAVARWMYGKTHGVRSGTRSKASKFLKLSYLAKPGAPVRFRGDLALLRAAYDDLVAYGEGLRKCLRETSQIDVLASHFPDYSDLNMFYGCDPRTLIGARAKDIPTGVKLAESVFATVVDWSHAQIHKKLKTAAASILPNP